MFNLSINGSWREAADHYAISAGVNGDRSMILDLDATDPAGWDQDTSPHAGMSYTDAIIYEAHIRDFTVDDSSGVSDAYKGKFLGMIQSGTTTPGGNTTGLDYLKELGITHLQLMPVYDFKSVDEWHLTDWDQYYILAYVVHDDGTISYSSVIPYSIEQYINNKANGANTSDAMRLLAQRLYLYERAAKEGVPKQ